MKPQEHTNQPGAPLSIEQAEHARLSRNVHAAIIEKYGSMNKFSIVEGIPATTVRRWCNGKQVGSRLCLDGLITVSFRLGLSLSEMCRDREGMEK